MKLQNILEECTDQALDQLASDKVDEVSNLRLPRAIQIQEIISALSSLSYVGKALAPARPPTYAFIKLLMDAPNNSRSMEGFKEAVMALTDDFTHDAGDRKRLSDGKNYQLYLRILASAWESEGSIDRSEAQILEALRNELGIWTNEHLLLEHHPEVRPLWDGEHAFEGARNLLISSGLVLVYQDNFVIADEVCEQIRRAWNIELTDGAYIRLLNTLTGEQAREILEKTSLQVSGSKEERIQRVVGGLVPPSVALDALHINTIKDLCRKHEIPVSQAKADLIESLIDYFDTERDLAAQEELSKEPPPPPEPEERLLERTAFGALLRNMTIDQLYDILSSSGLAKSGAKNQRIERLLDCPFSETTLLGHLRGTDLLGLCRKLGVPVSGVKAERIERLLERVAQFRHAPPAELIQHVPPQEEAAVKARPAIMPSPLSEAVDQSTPLSPPHGLHDVKVDFPDLEEEEHVILALIREARSLTEADVERAALQRKLGWFLTKAHMADLLAKLSKAGEQAIRIRSTGGMNIYEWIGKGARVEEAGKRGGARDMIDALRQGVVPERNLSLLAVGQEQARKHLLELLEHVETGRSSFKFVRGPYGSGKTFLCSWLREMAFERDFAVSNVCIGPDQPISDLPIFFSGLVNGLRTPEKKDTSALADVIESWLLAVHRKTAKIEGLAPFDPQTREQLVPAVQKRIADELERIAGHDPGVAPAIIAYYRACLEDRQDTANTALAWLRGSRSLSAQALHSIGVRGQLEGDQVFPRMRALLQIIAGGHLRGLLLLVDELELVRRFPHARQREQAYETLRLLIDESGENALPRCLLIFTGTDAFFDDNRYGICSYEALANRISAPRGIEGHVSMRQPVINLERLGRDWLLAVSRRVREMHGTAYGWLATARVSDAFLERMVDEWTSFGSDRIDRLPRPILRELVHVLDLCEENPEVNPDEFFRMPQSTKDLAVSMADLLGS